tara:strand:- start:2275 stop:2751 length:477 start_codon:yes stop_codon:yes gene_type:complete
LGSKIHKNKISIALYQPDIPQNTGSIMRLAACFGFTLHIIEPAGFLIDDKRLKRVAMDYVAYLELVRHESWNKFYSWSRTQSKRILLATTKASQSYLDVEYQPNDVIIFGRESSGVPDKVHDKSDVRIRIMMQNNIRSFNVSNSCAIIMSEAIRQISA